MPTREQNQPPRCSLRLPIATGSFVLALNATYPDIRVQPQARQYTPTAKCLTPYEASYARHGSPAAAPFPCHLPSLVHRYGSRMICRVPDVSSRFVRIAIRADQTLPVRHTEAISAFVPGRLKACAFPPSIARRTTYRTTHLGIAIPGKTLISPGCTARRTFMRSTFWGASHLLR